MARYPDGKEFLLCPGPFGAHNLAAMSYNPKSGLVYIPKIDLCMVYKDPPGDLKEWKPQGAFVINPGVSLGAGSLSVKDGSSSLLAWNPVTQKAAWEVPLPSVNNGGTATTAGNLVFQGTVTGEFRAYAADSGKQLWSFDAQAGIQAQPITYLVEGRQYVTVIAGWRGFGTAMGLKPEWDYRAQQRRVLTFALDAKGTLPARAAPPPFVDDPAFVIDEEKAARGMPDYEVRCYLCHGIGVIAGGAGPDLRRSKIVLSLEAMRAVVHDGRLAPRGMPTYGEITPEQLEAIQHYIRKKARAAIAASQ
jgi:quinohemoprotein ethanol dehydrogenase